MKKLFVRVAAVAAMFVIAVHFQTIIFSQTKPLTLDQISRAISTFSKDKKLLKKIIADVQNRGVDFFLTAENEIRLRKEGATDEFIDAIKENSLSLPKPIEISPSTKTETLTQYQHLLSVYLERGDEFFKKFDFDRAVEEYNKALELDPENVYALIQRGYIKHYKRSSNFDFSVAGIAPDFSDYNSAIKISPKLSSEPKMICVLYDPTQGDADNAVENCNTAIATKPDFSLFYYKRALAYFHQGKFDQAIKDYNKAIALYPDFYNAYINRGLMLSVGRGEKANLDKALADFNKAISINPKSVSAYFRRGWLFEQRANYDKAIEDFNKVVELEPKKASSYHERGIRYYYRGASYYTTQQKTKGEADFRAAKSDFEKAVELDPILVKEVSEAYVRIGVIKQSVFEFTRAVELNPKSFNAYFQRGRFFAGKKEYDNAIADFDKAIEINPNNGYAFEERGLCHYLKQSYDLALSDYNKSIEIYPQNAFAYNQRADVFEKTGKKDLAQADRKKADELLKNTKR